MTTLHLQGAHREHKCTLSKVRGQVSARERPLSLITLTLLFLVLGLRTGSILMASPQQPGAAPRTAAPAPQQEDSAPVTCTSGRPPPFSSSH